MTTGHDSLAAQLATSLFGRATGDPFKDAMRQAALAGEDRLNEMVRTGFTTNTPFDNVCQSQYVEDNVPFLLVSLTTNTTYFVMVTKRVDTGLHVAVAVHQENQNPRVENLRKMTLKCGQDGNVHAMPGW